MKLCFVGVSMWLPSFGFVTLWCDMGGLLFFVLLFCVVVFLRFVGCLQLLVSVVLVCIMFVVYFGLVGLFSLLGLRTRVCFSWGCCMVFWIVLFWGVNSVVCFLYFLFVVAVWIMNAYWIVVGYCVFVAF